LKLSIVFYKQVGFIIIEKMEVAKLDVAKWREFENRQLIRLLLLIIII